MAGITTIQELTESHPKALSRDLSEVVGLLNEEAKNLRSSVSRVALTALGALFLAHKRTLDPHVEKAPITPA